MEEEGDERKEDTDVSARKSQARAAERQQGGAQGSKMSAPGSETVSTDGKYRFLWCPRAVGVQRDPDERRRQQEPTEAGV